MILPWRIPIPTNQGMGIERIRLASAWSMPIVVPSVLGPFVEDLPNLLAAWGHTSGTRGRETVVSTVTPCDQEMALVLAG